MIQSRWISLWCVLPLLAQTERGNITGQVKDPSAGAIAGAEVVATHTGTNVQSKTITTAAGEYNLPIPPGPQPCAPS